MPEQPAAEREFALIEIGWRIHKRREGTLNGLIYDITLDMHRGIARANSRKAKYSEALEAALLEAEKQSKDLGLLT